MEDRQPAIDPTKLTTDAVNAMKGQLTELFYARLDAVQLQIDRFRWEIDQRPEVVEAQLARLAELMDEKFRGVTQQFAGRDTALAAALLAQKTSVEEQNRSNAASATKSEVGFDKRIEGIAALIASQGSNADSKINDLKDRITIIESRGKGQADGWGYIVGAAGVVLTIASIIGIVITALSKAV